MTTLHPGASERRTRRLVPKPAGVKRLETRIAARVPLHPNVLSGAKLLIVAPLHLLALRWSSAPLAIVLFVLFGALDYLDGVVARECGKTTSFGRVFDRITDYPLLIGLSYFCLDVLPLPLVASKIAVDLLLLVLYVLGRGSTENRLRTAMSYTTLLALMALSQNWFPTFVKPNTVVCLLIVNIAFSSTVALYNLDVLQKRFIADALSFANLTCGLVAMFAAAQGNLGMSLLLVLLGAGFDGFDGAAARRWGGTRFGVYSDDVADGVNFGLAPGVTVYFALGSTQEGAVIGGLFAVVTVTRLVFFTLDKLDADDNDFRGAPSPLGAILTMCGAIVLRDHPAMLGLLVGVACAQMIAFSARYRHIGRAIANRRRRAIWVPVLLVAVGLGLAVGGEEGAAVVLLAVCVVYALLPNFRDFYAVVTRAKQRKDLDSIETAR